MTASIFIKSYPPDYGWLSYALRSINKFCHGFSEIVVAIPEGSDLPLTQERIVKVSEPISGDGMHGLGYAFQQVVKMRADKYCKSDFICHMDSDSLFIKPVTPDDLMVDGKPLWLMTPMAEVMAGDKNTAAHATSMKVFSGIEPEFEYMRRIGAVIPRWAYGCFRDYVQQLHGMSFETWATAQPFRGVTEFNFIGQFLHREFPNLIHFHDTQFGIPDSFVKQYWSWSGLTPEIRQEMDAILA